MGIFIIIFIIITLAGFFEGAMDTLQFHFHTSIFSKIDSTFWNPENSWKNKYLDGDPSKGPKFPLSTTFLVSLTDGWHLFKLIRNILLFISLTAAGSLVEYGIYVFIVALLCRSFYGLGFYIAYYKILLNR
jgi:hypothetical protein